mgnify:FL=1
MALRFKNLPANKMSASVQIKSAASPEKNKLMAKAFKSPQVKADHLKLSGITVVGDIETKVEEPEPEVPQNPTLKLLEQGLLNVKLREFKCPKHPESKITRILNRATAPQILYCTQCVIDADPNLNPLFVPFERMLCEIQIQLENLDALKVDSKPPEMLAELAYKQDSFNSRFFQHIQKQKTRVVEYVRTIEDEVLKILRDHEQRLLAELDMQVKLYAKNLEEYRKKMNKFYSFDEEHKTLTIEDIFEQVNASADITELDIRMRGFLNEFEEANKILDERVLDPQSVILDSMNV